MQKILPVVTADGRLRLMGGSIIPIFSLLQLVRVVRTGDLVTQKLLTIKVVRSLSG